MPTVTSITRRRGAIAIQLAGEACEHLLAREPVEARALSEGVALEESEWAELRATGRRRLALERALASLSHRSHTEHELRRRLRRQFVDEEIDTAIDRLRELGYLDDARWASEFVEARRGRLGARRLRQDLVRRGVGREHVEAATDNLDEAAAAMATARRRVPTLRRLEPDLQRRRLYGYLQHRGFSHDVTRRAIAEVLTVDIDLD